MKKKGEVQLEIDFEDSIEESLEDYIEIPEGFMEETLTPPILVQSEVLEMAGFVSVTVGTDHLTVPFDLMEELILSLLKAQKKIAKYYRGVDEEITTMNEETFKKLFIGDYSVHSDSDSY